MSAHSKIVSSAMAALRRQVVSAYGCQCYGCAHRQKCRDEKLACHAFVVWVQHAGRFGSRRHPRRHYYEMVFTDVTGASVQDEAFDEQ